jgi:L-Ala-D/L-Glu epimerase / N-acetyl-D-glutamate racemase
MKIGKIECTPVSLRFAKPVVMTGGAEACSHAVVVKIHTDEGITGISESGGTSPWYMGESQDSIMHNINHVFGPEILLGENPFNIERIVAGKDRVAKVNNQALHILKKMTVKYRF